MITTATKYRKVDYQYLRELCTYFKLLQNSNKKAISHLDLHPDKLIRWQRQLGDSLIIDRECIEVLNLSLRFLNRSKCFKTLEAFALFKKQYPKLKYQGSYIEHCFIGDRTLLNDTVSDEQFMNAFVLVSTNHSMRVLRPHVKYNRSIFFNIGLYLYTQSDK